MHVKEVIKYLPATYYVSVICTVCAGDMIPCSTKPCNVGVSCHNTIHLVCI